jgi:hypothetical protein
MQAEIVKCCRVVVWLHSLSFNIECLIGIRTDDYRVWGTVLRLWLG